MRGSDPDATIYWLCLLYTSLDWYKSPITVDEANEFEGVLEASLELRSAVTKARCV